MKDDELALFMQVYMGRWPRDAAAVLKIPYKRSCYLCEKWVRKGLYDYGVSADLGWLTDKGVALAESIESGRAKETP